MPPSCTWGSTSHLRKRMPRTASQAEWLRDRLGPVDEVGAGADERDVKPAAAHQVVERDYGFQRGDTTAHDHDLRAVVAVARGCNVGGHAFTVSAKAGAGDRSRPRSRARNYRTTEAARGRSQRALHNHRLGRRDTCDRHRNGAGTCVSGAPNDPDGCASVMG
jgi:hypothetical protein